MMEWQCLLNIIVLVVFHVPGATCMVNNCLLFYGSSQSVLKYTEDRFAERERTERRREGGGREEGGRKERMDRESSEGRDEREKELG